MIEYKYVNTIENAKKILCDAKDEYCKFIKSDISSKITIDLKNGSREKNIIDFASHIAIGDNKKTEHFVKKLLENNLLGVNDMHNIMQHVAVYCGFPVEMNGLSVLHKIEIEKTK